jgi:hypothetical protein
MEKVHYRRAKPDVDEPTSRGPKGSTRRDNQICANRKENSGYFVKNKYSAAPSDGNPTERANVDCSSSDAVEILAGTFP